MSTKERPFQFPVLPDPWPRPADFVPTPPPVAVAREPATTPGEAAPTPSQRWVNEFAGTIASDPPPAPTSLPESAQPAAEPATPRTERTQERVQLSGRVGKDPTFWLTANNIPRAKFPIGVKEDPATDTTTWHEVQAWRRVAEQVRDTVKRGDAVEVIAYREVTEVQGTRGPRQVEHLRAVVVKRRG